MTGSLSVILPLLDEAARIQARLRELSQLPGVDEVIAVDGGSRDGTAAIVEAHPGVILLHSTRGRARQMNAGASAARGSVLLFLHADVSLPQDAATLIGAALAKPNVVAGAFRTWTVDDTGRRSARWLHLADLRSRYSRLPYGDQAIFVRREAFQAVGGFPEQPLMEDLELSLRLSKLGKIHIVPARVRVSGRRFLSHPLRDTLWVNLFPLLYRFGVSPDRLKRLYEDVR